MVIALFLNLIIIGLINGISFLFISFKVKKIYIHVNTIKSQIENHIEEARLQNKQILDLNKEILKESLHALKNIKELKGIVTIIEELENKINSIK